VIRLTLMRHANAQWNDSEISDFERPLNCRGHSEAEAMARRMSELGLCPALLFVSTARRALQTAETVAQEVGVPARYICREESLYLAPAEEILRLVRATGPRIPHVMVVGHNPGISEAANLLAPNREIGHLNTAAMCSFTFDAHSWGRVGANTLRDSVNEAPPARLFALWA
jgi:phosphohistidine phosphatase